MNNPGNSMKTKIYEPQSVILPEEASIHRVFPFKGPNQLDWIDDTIFYDVFFKYDNRAIICIGPPLLNLKGALELQEISCDGKQLRYSRTKFLRDHSLIVIKVPRSLRSELIVQLSFRFNLFEKVVEVSRNHHSARESKSGFLTLVTLQKDNPLQWIRDWIHWHNRMHGIGQLILYDNGSREYGHDELVDTLRQEKQDFQSVLVNWNFPYTWDGWDGRRPTWYPWPQIAALNHCYLKYGDCGWLLNLDIDEYLVAEDDTSLRDYLRQTHQHYLPLRERQVQGIGPKKPLAERSFRDFSYRTRELKVWHPLHHRKYACQCNIPSLWLDVHWVVHKGFNRFRFQIKLYYTAKRMGLIELFSKIMINNSSPAEMFWVYHFMPLATIWEGSHERRGNYPDKAHFDAQGVEIIYDDTMIKQAKKHGL